MPLFAWYVGGVASLVCPMLMLPTIRDIQQTPPGFGQTRLSLAELGLKLLTNKDLVVYSPVSAKTVQEELLLNERNLERGKYWTLVTQAFIHVDPQHLVNNLGLLIPAGASVAKSYGDSVLFSTFLIGAALSGSNINNVKYKQRARTIMSQFGFAQRGPADGSLLNGLRSAWNSGVRVVANTAAPFVHRRTTYCGASGGASALLALDVLTALERLPNQPLAVWVLSTPSLLSAFSMVYGEWTSYNSQGSSDGVDHSAHLVGFVVGVAIFAALKLRHTLRKLRRSR